MAEAKEQSRTEGRRRGREEPLSRYLRDIGDWVPLDAAAEGALARRIRTGDAAARNTLVEANLRFVVSVAKEYHGRGLPLAELISAGNVGLITAAERFDETRGFKFITYAVWWVRQSILQSLMEQSTVRVPVNRLDLLMKITRAVEALQQDGQSPSYENVAARLGCSVREVEQTLLSGQPVRSLDAPFDGGEDRCLLDCLPGADEDSVEAEALGFSLREDVEEALEALSPREAAVLRCYYGIGGEERLTLEEIGQRLRLTRERVRQIKETALSRLRHPRFRARLRAYADN